MSPITNGRRHPQSCIGWDLRDLEHADVLCRRDGTTLSEMLAEWRASDHNQVSLSEWLIYCEGPNPPPSQRSSALAGALENSFQAILSHMRDQGPENIE